MSRAFVVDHMAAQPTAHHLHSVNIFSDCLSDRFDEVIPLVSKDLPANVEETEKVHRELYYPYNGINETRCLFSKFPKKRNAFVSRCVQFSTRNMFYLFSKMLGKDVVLSKVEKDWRRIIRKYEINEADSIFFVNADSYGVLGFLHCLDGVPKSKRPAIHCRLINVYERYSFSSKSRSNFLLDKVNELMKKGFRVSVSAETPSYAKHLSDFFGKEVLELPYPLVKAWAPPRWEEGRFLLASPGQGRGEKGYFELVELAKRFPHLKIIAQSMRKIDPDYSKAYQDSLKKITNIELFPERISQNQIEKLQLDADVLLMLYDPQRYHQRGSAVYQEGVAFGRMVVCMDGAGAADWVKHYGNGVVAKNIDDVDRCLKQLMSLAKSEVVSITQRARERYEADFSFALERIFNFD